MMQGSIPNTNRDVAFLHGFQPRSYTGRRALCLNREGNEIKTPFQLVSKLKMCGAVPPLVML